MAKMRAPRGKAVYTTFNSVSFSPLTEKQRARASTKDVRAFSQISRVTASQYNLSSQQIKEIDEMAAVYGQVVYDVIIDELARFGSQVNKQYAEIVSDFHGPDTKLQGVPRGVISLNGKAVPVSDLHKSGKTLTQASLTNIGVGTAVLGKHKHMERKSSRQWWKSDTTSWAKPYVTSKSGHFEPGNKKSVELYLGFGSESGKWNEIAFQREFGFTSKGKRNIVARNGMVIPLYGRGLSLAMNDSPNGLEGASDLMSKLPRKFLYNQFASKILKGGDAPRWTDEEFWTEAGGGLTKTDTFYKWPSDDKDMALAQMPSHSDEKIQGDLRAAHVKKLQGMTLESQTVQTGSKSQTYGKWINMPKGGNVRAIYVLNPAMLYSASGSKYGQTQYAGGQHFMEQVTQQQFGALNTNQLKDVDGTVYRKKDVTGILEPKKDRLNRTRQVKASRAGLSYRDGIATQNIKSGKNWWEMNAEVLQKGLGYDMETPEAFKYRTLSANEDIGGAAIMLTQNYTSELMVGHERAMPLRFTTDMRVDVSDDMGNSRRVRFLDRDSENRIKLSNTRSQTEMLEGMTANQRRHFGSHRGTAVSGVEAQIRPGFVGISEGDGFLQDYVVNGSKATLSGRVGQRAIEYAYKVPTYQSIVRDPRWAGTKGSARYLVTSTGIVASDIQHQSGFRPTGLASVINSHGSLTQSSSAGKKTSHNVSRIANYFSHHNSWHYAPHARSNHRTAGDVVGRDLARQNSKKEAFTQMSKAFSQLDTLSPVLSEVDSVAKGGQSGMFNRVQGLARQVPLFAKVTTVKIGSPNKHMAKAIDSVANNPNTKLFAKFNAKLQKVLGSGQKVSRNNISSMGGQISASWASQARTGKARI